MSLLSDKLKVVDGYFFPNAEYGHPKEFDTDEDFVGFLEQDARGIFRCYVQREDEMRRKILGDKECMNHAFEFAGVLYLDWEFSAKA